MSRVPLHWQIFAALAAAFIVGRLVGDSAAIFGITFVEIFGFVGDLFLRSLRMLIVPLIASAIITGVAGMGAERAFARLGAKTVAYFLGTGLIAVVVGVSLVNWIEPGISNGKPVNLGLTADTSAVQKAVGERSGKDVVGVFLRMIPENIVSTAGNNSDVLALIVFSILFGYFSGRMNSEHARTVNSFWLGVYDIMLRITDLVMKFAPIGIFALVAKIAATLDFAQLGHLLWFVLTVAGGLGIHVFIVLPLLVWIFARVNPVNLFRATAPALLTAFSTSSSSATIPLTMECVQKNAGVSSRISGFVIPLGATVNMNGTALFECVAAIFIAQLYGLDLSFGTQLTVVILALFTSIGVAGVPSASLVAIVVILGVIGLPAEGIGLIMVVERLLDMARTSVNVFGDACGAVIIARSEGEQNLCTGTAGKA